MRRQRYLLRLHHLTPSHTSSNTLHARYLDLLAAYLCVLAIDRASCPSGPAQAQSHTLSKAVVNVRKPAEIDGYNSHQDVWHVSDFDIFW